MVRKHIVVDPGVVDKNGGALPENGVVADDLQIVDIRCDLGGCLQAVAGDAGLIQINIRIIRILCDDVGGLAVLREMDAPNVQVQRTGRAVDCNGKMADLFVNILQSGGLRRFNDRFQVVRCERGGLFRIRTSSICQHGRGVRLVNGAVGGEVDRTMDDILCDDA